MKYYHIDLNCDMGESYGNFKIGNDDRIFPYITSCNIACGFHGGDPFHIENTIKKALKYGVQIGAHPSYPDLQGFGRRKMQVPANELKAIIKYQIAAIKGMTESLGGELTYVKPHGALYNTAADDEIVASSIIQAIKEIDGNLKILGLAGSQMKSIALREGIRFIAEAFADRKYTNNGRLKSRTQTGAVLHDPKKATEQVLSLVMDKEVISDENQAVRVAAKSICIHGDNPNVEVILQTIDEQFKAHNISKRSF